MSSLNMETVLPLIMVKISKRRKKWVALKDANFSSQCQSGIEISLNFKLRFKPNKNAQEFQDAVPCWIVSHVFFFFLIINLVKTLRMKLQTWEIEMHSLQNNLDIFSYVTYCHFYDAENVHVRKQGN